MVLNEQQRYPRGYLVLCEGRLFDDRPQQIEQSVAHNFMVPELLLTLIKPQQQRNPKPGTPKTKAHVMKLGSTHSLVRFRPPGPVDSTD